MKKVLVIIGIIVAVPAVALIGLIVFFAISLKGRTEAEKARYNTAARAGVPIVQAIYDYRNAMELYPETVEDLSRVTATRVDTKLWSYSWQNHYAQLDYIGKEVSPGLTYAFADGHSGWSVQNRLYYGTSIDAPLVIPPRPKRTPAEKHRLIVEEIERRVGRDSTIAIHHQGLISYRIKAGDLAGALADASRMHKLKLLPWWELQILARVLHQRGEENWAEKEMRALAEQEQGFVPFFYLAWFYRETGQTEAALQMIRKASASPFRTMPRDHYVDDYYFWLAAIYAYRERHSDLVLAVCDAWEANDAKHGYGSADPQALRAAALLAQGNTVQAQSCIDRAIELRGNRAIWAENLDGLSKAIQRGEKDYRWNPGSFPEIDGYELLIVYQ